MDPPPPPYNVQASMSRSRTGNRNVQNMADAMLRSAISRTQASSTSPTTLTASNAPTAATNNPTTAPIAVIATTSTSTDVTPTARPASSASGIAPSTTSNDSVSTTSVLPYPTSPSSSSFRSDSASTSTNLPYPTSPSSTTFKVDPPAAYNASSTTINTTVLPDRRRSSLTSSGYLPIMGSALPKKRKDSDPSSRLQSAEQENEELRRQVEKLKREAEKSSYLSKKDAKARVAQLKTETKAANAEAAISLKPPSTAGLFRSACSTDLVFLIDCTNSMRREIDTVKNNVKKIVADIHKAFFNQAVIRVGVVAYRDHGAKVNIEALDFTSSPDEVVKFLDGLVTYYGHDIPEDVLGGIQKALNLSWDQPTRCLIHIGDAPPHGRIFQDEPYDWDRYPDVGTEPHGLLHEPLLQLMARMNINYAFLPIHKCTDRMAFEFSKIYLAEFADVKLNAKSQYLQELTQLSQEQKRGQVEGSSQRNEQGRLMFVVADIGSIYTYLRNLVVKCVLSSATRTASRASEAMSGVTRSKDLMSSNLAVVNEKFEMESGSPQWDNSAWFEETIEMEGFSPDVIVHSSRTLDDMMQSDDNIKMSTTDLLIHKRSQPFAQGAMRVAFYSRTAYSVTPLVVKAFKYKSKKLAHLVEEMRCQALCKAFALEFNAKVRKEAAIDFLVTASLMGKSQSPNSEDRLSMEPYVQGEYVKYNNNCGYVNEELEKDETNQAAQAFSHFTFERSRGRFLISDLQGVGHILTDPAVHTKDEQRFRLADTNLGEDGFKFFFATHQCNSICHSLQLKSNAEMLLTGCYSFRDKWPSTSSTVCCSNKFCGKIVNTTSAKTMLVYPGFYWCDDCFPQIDRTRIRRPCVAPGPDHTFEVSAFFFESQGRMIPKTCPSHRRREETVRPPSLTDSGGGLFKKLGFGGKSKK